VGFFAPRSFTGENSLEITCHNNSLVITNILDLFLQHGARLAEPGEFSKRAFLNNKIDLSQAEAIHEIITAQNQVALQASLSQLQGSMSAVLLRVTNLLMSLCATLEAYFEFSEEEVIDIDLARIFLDKLTTIKQELSHVIWSNQQQTMLREGVRIALVGPTNAGKSTLFNALLRKDRALVSNIAGTTRDIIEGQRVTGNVLWTLVDTAGIRSSTDELELLGIDKSLQELKCADILLVVLDGAKKITAEEKGLLQELAETHQEKFILLLNKKDLGLKVASAELNMPLGTTILEICGASTKSLDQLEAALEEKVTALFSGCAATPFILNKRQQSLISQLKIRLDEIEADFKAKVPCEILVVELKKMLELCSDLTGKGVAESILDQIFASFCVGK